MLAGLALAMHLVLVSFPCAALSWEEGGCFSFTLWGAFYPRTLWLPRAGPEPLASEGSPSLLGTEGSGSW